MQTVSNAMEVLLDLSISLKGDKIRLLDQITEALSSGDPIANRICKALSKE